MSQLWFESATGPERNRGHFYFSVSAVGTRGLLSMDLVYPHNLNLESEQVSAHLGGAVNAIGIALIEEGVDIPESLRRWVEEPTRPASELGGWASEIIAVNNSPLLGARRIFDDMRVVATIIDRVYVAVIVPKALEMVRLIG